MAAHLPSPTPDAGRAFGVLEALLEALAVGAGPEALAETTAHLLTNTLGYPIAAVVTRDPMRMRFSLQVVHPQAFLEAGLAPEDLATLEKMRAGFWPEARPGHQALLEGEARVTTALADFLPEALAAAVENATRQHLGTGAIRYAAVPIALEQQVMAALAVVVAGREMQSEELDLLRAVGRPLAMGLERLRLSHRADVLYRTFTGISRGLDLPDLLEAAVRWGAEALDAPAASLTLWDRETDTLRIVASHGLSKEYVRGQVTPGDEARQVGKAAGWKPFVVPDRTRVGWGDRELAAREGLRTMLVVPLQVGRGWLGSLNIYSKEEGRTFSEEEIALAEAVGRQVAAALHNARLYERAQRRLDEMTALRNLALQMAEPQPLDALLQRVVEEAARLVGVDAGGLYLLDEATGELELVVSHRLRKPRIGTRLKAGEGLCGKVTQTGVPMAVADYSTWPGRSPRWDDEGVRANAAVPLQWGGRTLGVLGVLSHERPHPFTERELHLLELFAQQAAVAVENARLREEAERRLAEMTALRDLALELNRPQPLDTLLQRIVEEATRLAGTNSGVLYLYDEEAQELELAVSHNIGEHHPGLRMRVGEGLAGKVVETGGPVSVEDYGTWEWRSPQWEDPRIYASVAVPLERGGHILGTLGITALEPGKRFGEDEVRLLTLFGQQAAVAIESARLLESLRREKAFTEGLLETAPVLVVVLDPEGRILTFNQACEELTGYRKEEVLGKSWFDLFIPPRQREDLEQVFAGVQAGVRDFRYYENPILTRDGRERIISWSNSVIRDAEGRVQRVLAIGQDVTEQREAEREILRRSTELSLLVEAGQEFARELDWERTLHRVAHQARDLVGADSCTVFVLDEDGETLRPAVAVGPEAEAVMQFRLKLGEGITGHVALKGEPELVNQAHLDPRAVHVPGTEREPESLLCAPLVARGETIGILVLSRLGGREFTPEDLRFAVGLANLAAPAILNARLYQQARQEAAHRIKMMESMLEGVVVLDPTGRIVEVNQAFCRMTGFDCEELLECTPPFPHWPPGRADELARLLETGLRRRVPMGPVEVTFQRKDGDTFPALLTISPMRDEAGRFVGLVAGIQDMTERRALEEQLRQAQKMEAIGTLAGGIAHDFNNILVGILGYASLLQTELPEGSPLQKDVEVIIRSARRAADLTQQLLSFARRS